jgi:hypothetical protein
MTRKKAFISMSDNNDDYSEDHITSYCERCESFGFLSELKERIYPDNEPIPSDSDNWMQCHRCGTIIAKVHVKHVTKLKGFVDIPDTIYDSGKTIIETVNSGKYPTSKRRKQFIKNLNRLDHRIEPQDKDKDLQNLLNQGRILINYTIEEIQE